VDVVDVARVPGQLADALGNVLARGVGGVKLVERRSGDGVEQAMAGGLGLVDEVTVERVEVLVHERAVLVAQARGGALGGLDACRPRLGGDGFGGGELQRQLVRLARGRPAVPVGVGQLVLQLGGEARDVLMRGAVRGAHRLWIVRTSFPARAMVVPNVCRRSWKSKSSRRPAATSAFR
jgi:hypothetical protein